MYYNVIFDYCNTFRIKCKRVIVMGVEKKVVSIRLDEDFIEELKACAKLENRPLSNFIETVLKEYIKKQKK